MRCTLAWTAGGLVRLADLPHKWRQAICQKFQFFGQKSIFFDSWRQIFKTIFAKKTIFLVLFSLFSKIGKSWRQILTTFLKRLATFLRRHETWRHEPSAPACGEPPAVVDASFRHVGQLYWQHANHQSAASHMQLPIYTTSAARKKSKRKNVHKSTHIAKSHGDIF